MTESAAERKTRIKAQIKQTQEELKRFKTESQEQPDFLNWFKATFPDVLIISIPNGSRRGKNAGKQLQRQGLVAGVPDLYVPAWRLWIEMKQAHSGTLSKEQKKIIAYLRGIGDNVIVSHGAEMAKAEVLKFRAENQSEEGMGACTSM